MRGHVRRRGARWEFVIELGEQPAQLCVECGKLAWLDGKPLERCECGGELEEVRRRRQYTKGGYRLKNEALSALNKQLTARAEGTYQEPSNLTVAEFLIGRWLPDAKTTIKATTFLAYQHHVHAYLVPHLGGLRLRLLDPGHVNGMYRELAENGGRRGKGLTSATIRRVHATLRRSLRDAVRWGLVPRNVAALADPPKLDGHRTMKVWTAEQLKTFLAHVADDRSYPLWRTLATTGMRRGEVLGLQWQDVDFEHSCLRVQRARVTCGYRVEVTTTKNGHGRVVLPGTKTMQALREWRDAQADELLELSAAQSPEGFVFTDKTGEPLHPDRATKRFYELQAGLRAELRKRHEESGEQGDPPELPVLRVHDLRHTYASIALANGTHPKIVQEALGHSSIAITMNTYSHVIPTLQESAAERLAALIDADE